MIETIRDSGSTGPRSGARPYKNYDYAGDRKIDGVIRSQPDPKAFVRETGRELPSQRLIEPSKGSVKKFMESLILAQD